LRLFCFPCAGAGPSLFTSWPGRLPGDVEVCAISYPGREVRWQEASITRLHALVDALADALDPFQDRPFAFVGLSLGGCVAFELARRCRQAGRVMPAHLFLAACGAPQCRLSRPPIYDLPQERFLEALRARYGEGIPEALLRDASFRNLYLPPLRSDVEMLDTYTYRPDPPLQIPITAYRGAQDPAVRPEEVDRWREQTLGAFAVHTLPGGHFFWRDSSPAFLGLLAGDLALTLRVSALQVRPG
jgi:medium-chain acyl-[acyl-carrier-protein] hydrolase